MAFNQQQPWGFEDFFDDDYFRESYDSAPPEFFDSNTNLGFLNWCHAQERRRTSRHPTLRALAPRLILESDEDRHRHIHGEMVLEKTGLSDTYIIEEIGRIGTYAPASLAISTAGQQPQPSLAIPTAGQQPQPSLAIPTAGQQLQPFLAMPTTGQQLQPSRSPEREPKSDGRLELENTIRHFYVQKIGFVGKFHIK